MMLLPLSKGTSHPPLQSGTIYAGVWTFGTRNTRASGRIGDEFDGNRGCSRITSRSVHGSLERRGMADRRKYVRSLNKTESIRCIDDLRITN